jgi:hypothetical protein
VEEVWKPIEGFNGRYEVSNMGRINSNVVPWKDTILKPRKNKPNGYLRVGLRKEPYSKIIFLRVHRIVAETFIENPENKAEVNHIDGDKNNNCIYNLEWVTREENIKHAFKTGLMKPPKKKN